MSYKEASSGIEDLDQLLASMEPSLEAGEFVFCSYPGARYGDLANLRPVVSVLETEGLSLVLDREEAESAGIDFEAVMRRIVLRVHSSLVATGLTATVSAALARNGISANMIAGFFHDHIYVPVDRAEEALRVLQDLQESNRG